MAGTFNLDKKDKKFLPANFQILLLPLGLLLVLVILFVVAIRVGFSRISAQRQSLSESQRNENILSQKQSVLSELQPELETSADATTLSMPDKNPALLVFSQLKGVAASNGVALINLKISPEVKEKEISRIEILLDVDGDIFQIISFMEQLHDIAPLVQLERIKINQSGGLARANTTLRGYWADFPEKLPPLTEPVKELTSDEVDLLTRLSTLVPPLFSNLSPTEPTVRGDPFQ